MKSPFPFLLIMFVVVFGSGFVIGFFSERTGMMYTQSEIERLRNQVDNMQLQEMFITGEKVDCKLMYSTMGSLSYSLYSMVDSLKATGNVIIESEERNAKMETPQILWVAAIHKVFADTVRLSTEDAVEEGVRFEATDDLKSYTMKNVSGEVQGRDITIPER